MSTTAGPVVRCTVKVPCRARAASARRWCPAFACGPDVGGAAAGDDAGDGAVAAAGVLEPPESAAKATPPTAAAAMAAPAAPRATVRLMRSASVVHVRPAFVLCSDQVRTAGGTGRGAG